MPTITWGADVRDGKMYLHRRDDFDVWLKSRRNGRYVLTLKEHRERRTSPQNRYYWGCVVKILADEWGWDTDDLHYELRRKFLQVGDFTQPPRHTADLDTAEMTRFIDDVRRLAAECGVYIPDPNEVET